MPMMKVRKPLIVMGVVFTASVAGAVIFAKPIANTWHHNPIANSAILGLLSFGLLYALYSLIALWRGQRQWPVLEHSGDHWNDTIPLRGVLSFFKGRLLQELGSADARLREEVIDSFDSSLSMRVRLSEYLAGLLIGLGLLGTFLGLMATMSDIGAVLTTLNSPDGGNVQDMLGSLSMPLAGMSSAFSASLMGLLGSLLMGAIAQFMADANDQLVQNIRTWSQRRKVKDELAAGYVSKPGSSTEFSDSPLLHSFKHDVLGLLAAWRHSAEQRDNALFGVSEALAASNQHQLDCLSSIRDNLDQVPALLTGLSAQIETLSKCNHELVSHSAATNQSMDRAALGLTHVVGALDENRVNVNGAARALAATLTDMSGDAASIVRRLASLEDVLALGATQTNHMTQSLVAQQDALQEMVRQVAALATGTSMQRAVLQQPKLAPSMEAESIGADNKAESNVLA